MKKNEEFIITIEDMSEDGSGVGKQEGYIWFIKDTVIGDVVRAGAMKMKKNYGFARLIEVITPSKDRVEPRCPAARKCGGCQLQAMDYQAQLRFKERKVYNDLKRIGGLKDLRLEDMEPIMGMETPWRYRNKAQFPFGLNKDGRIITGFYAGRTHSIIEQEDCLLGIEENKEILEIIKQFMEDFRREGTGPYDEKSHQGLVRHALIRKGFATGELMVCLVINGRKLPHSEELVERLLKVPGMSSISYNINTEKTNVILGSELVNLYGPGYITDTIGDIKYQISPLSFYQVNPVQTRKLYQTALEFAGLNGGETVWDLYCGIGTISLFLISPLSFYQVNPVQTRKLYQTALEFAGLNGGETVWDLYCGIGTISLFLAQKAGKVYGVEIIPQAIEDAKRNARLNSLENVEFFVGKAEEVLPEQYEKNHIAADVIVVDPPRKGCDEHCLETIVKMAPPKVVYISCDPATLARDVKYLGENGYELKRVRCCDMFGQSVHVETGQGCQIPGGEWV